MRLQIDTRLMKPGQYFVFVLNVTSNQRGTSHGVGEYLVTGRLVPCRLSPAPALPPGVPEDTVVGGRPGGIVFADT